MSLFRRSGACSCKIEIVELLGGQHLANCKRNRIGKRVFGLAVGPDLAPFTVDPQAKHNVDGVDMPWVGIPTRDPRPPAKAFRGDGPDINNRWCDLSAHGDGAWIARQWPEIRTSATAYRLDGRWSWEVYSVTADGHFKQILHTGLVDSVATVIVVVDQIVSGVYAAIAADISTITGEAPAEQTLPQLHHA